MLCCLLVSFFFEELFSSKMIQSLSKLELKFTSEKCDEDPMNFVRLVDSFQMAKPSDTPKSWCFKELCLTTPSHSNRSWGEHSCIQLCSDYEFQCLFILFIIFLFRVLFQCLKIWNAVPPSLSFSTCLFFFPKKFKPFLLRK